MTREARHDHVLLVASTGGHLSELFQLRNSVGTSGSTISWVTFDTSQSRSLLMREDFDLLGFIRPRDYTGLLRNLPRAMQILRARRPRKVVSTGSAIALLFLPIAFAFGAKAVYIESAARISGPSVTGRVLSFVPWVEVYTQYERNVSLRWKFRYSVISKYAASAGEVAPLALHDEEPRVLVLMGTLHFPFDRLRARVLEIAPQDAHITWQLGYTPDSEDPSRPATFMPVHELEELAQHSTLIISHAGVGSALLALNAGVRPVLVPRLAAHGEHVDDHQVQVAQELASAGVVVYREVEQLQPELFRRDHRFHPTSSIAGHGPSS